MKKIDVLDGGYVAVHDDGVMGSDLSIVNSARVSYNKRKEVLDEQDIRLIKFLAREGHCYDEETEVLTSKGFKKWNEVTFDDELGAVDPNTGKLVGYETPIDLVKEKVSEELVVFETNDVSLKVTKGHSLYTSLSNTQKKITNPVFELKVANSLVDYNNGNQKEEVYKKPMRMIKSTKGSNLKSESKKFLFMLYGFFVGDGYASSANQIKFHLKKDRKIKYLKEIAEGLDWELFEQKSNNYVFKKENIGNEFRKMFYNDDKNKTFPDLFFLESQENIECFVDGLLNSDGSKKRNTYIYSTTSKELANKLQALTATNGIPMSLNKNERGLFILNINSRRNMPRLNDTKDNQYKLEYYDGYVYCATVSTGLLIIRRDNKVLLCGNTSPFRHATMQFEAKAPLMIARQW